MNLPPARSEDLPKLGTGRQVRATCQTSTSPPGTALWTWRSIVIPSFVVTRRERWLATVVIATFQAVSQRAADASIDARAINLTAWQAAILINDGLPATEAAEIAKFWAAEGGQRVVHAATHLHGSLPFGETMPDPFDVYLSSPVVWNGAVFFGSGDVLLGCARVLALEPHGQHAAKDAEQYADYAEADLDFLAHEQCRSLREFQRFCTFAA